MIQLITGNISYLLKQELLRWKQGFITKHGDIGVSHVQELNESNIQSIRDTILSRSFFSEKKLLILEDISFQDSLILEIIDILQQKDDDTIVLISLSHVDKRLSSYKKLLKIVSKHQDFSFQTPEENFGYLREKYSSHFSPGALRYLFEIKGGDLSKTLTEIHKLTEVYDYIDKDIIESIITPELNSSIFTLIDAFLNRNSKIFFNELRSLFANENFYLISQSFLSNIRLHLYIEYLKSNSVPNTDIIDILKLGNRSFLVSKTYRQKYKEIFSLYIDLIDFDSSMKRGKIATQGDEDLALFYTQIFLRYFS
ncbi:hypothetical protein LAT59_00465 [Candidatus Gracilibacteria bacterium]|nr:hypothetical protein [Candidatus Gracilibacteria bacterium]